MATWRAVVRINNATLGGTGTNTWHMRESGTGLGVHDHLNNIMGWVEDFYTAVQGSFDGATSFVFSGELLGLGAAEGDVQTVDPWTVAGADAGPSLPPANAVVVGWRTDSGGRQGRGRTFLGPMASSSAEADGTIKPAHLAGIRAGAAALVEESDSFDDGALGVYSREGGGVLRDFTSSRVRDTFAMLRSRRD